MDTLYTLDSGLMLGGGKEELLSVFESDKATLQLDWAEPLIYKSSFIPNLTTHGSR